ncbi:ATP-dependent DNA ligase [Frondihabitans australicus]|uniref:DNA ligase (ATP) n=1 Tax=Frondihabitans australicus TaxID=386892 RepID=A0A495IGX4_9MICO|nr:ATP-dependent DNA ligase [Frondihabitans australicus]RKR74561.1 ATP-dependent DNA ligase LigD ligase module /ATP-dependent DNA ligase LigD phosphoesterase module /ATP-dependent DNA ligase LigD polymerase module [Frondihabitans australicus]
MATKGRGERVTVGGHTLQLTNLDKVLYPETGTTKGDVIGYYAAVAEWMLPHVEDRPATRKRWVNGVAGEAFFEKNLPDSAPTWVARREIEHSDHTNVYPLVNDEATLAWLGQVAALEIHVPQWRFGPRGAQRNPDRLVLDLDPGEGVGLAECVEVAQELRKVVEGMGLALVPVTSGSKGLHLYAALDGKQTTDQVSEIAHELARAMEADHPDLVLSSMGKHDRRGKVFLDWSQNNGSKTTVAPYSLRGRSHPTVAAPRTWRELASKSLRQLEYTEVLARLKRRGDPLEGLSSGTPVPPGELDRDRLATYRSKRDASKTSEPVPASAPASSDGRSFVIQEHHARRLHWDFRLEHDGVLVSWALPKGEPQDPAHNRLAVQTEDHPLEYGTFEGTIAKGEYGAGTVTIWDSGEYDLEKWRDGEEVIAVLHGEQRGTRRVALIHTGRGDDTKTWLIHRMKDDAGDSDEESSSAGSTSRGSTSHGSSRSRPTRPPEPVHPMLATAGTEADLAALDADDWAFELKWDGVRAVVTVDHGEVRLTSRNDHDMTASYPELGVLADRLADAGVGSAVLDGEIVAVDAKGRPDFQILQSRMKLTKARDVARAQDRAPVRLLLFDLLELDGRSLRAEPYDDRRAALEKAVSLDAKDHTIDVPPAFEGSFDEAMTFSRKLGLEGVVAKRRDSTYSAGRRSRAWVKAKHHATQEVVIGGWRPGAGRRAGGVGSLLMGIPEGDGLRYVGRVGTGFSDRDLDDLLAAFERESRKTSPFVDVPAADSRDAHWITPRRVGEVSFAEWTTTGRLRQPSWRGWRPDKDAASVVAES